MAPRIGFCSWKSPRIQILASYQSRGVLYTICSENERVARAIAAHLSSETSLFLHLRKWHDIPLWSEFRIFIRDRRVIGISQYHHQSGFAEIPANERAIK
ncbi:cell division cycle 123 family protein, partial [Paracoccus halophilus]